MASLNARVGACVCECASGCRRAKADELTKFNSISICNHVQYTIRNGRGRFGIPGSDRKPLVLSTYQDAQQHLPYADDSNAVTPMSEENGAIIVPVYYGNLGELMCCYAA